MAESGTSGGMRSCLRYGCFGCVGVVALVAIAVGVIAGLALVLDAPPVEVVSPGLTQALPVPETRAEGSASSDVARGTLPEGPLEAPANGPAGRVVLDLSEASFELVPGDPGAPVRVDGTYDAGAYEVSEDFDPGPDGAWTYRLTFRRKVSWIRMVHGAEQNNRLRVILPRDVPFSIEGSVRRGDSDLDLGGLSITAVDLDLRQGDHRLRFSEPTPRPVGRIAIEASQGSFRMERVGNASPAELNVRGSMGESLLDLGGAWRNDGTIHGRWKMGELDVRVSRGLRLDVDDVGVFLGEADTTALGSLPPPEAGAPRLKLTLSVTMGNVVVEP